MWERRVQGKALSLIKVGFRETDFPLRWVKKKSKNKPRSETRRLWSLRCSSNASNSQGQQGRGEPRPTAGARWHRHMLRRGRLMESREQLRPPPRSPQVPVEPHMKETHCPSLGQQSHRLHENRQTCFSG